MSKHDYFSSGAVTVSPRAAMSNGTTGVTYGGTGNPIFAGNHMYHAAVALGTSTGAAGTLYVFGHTDSSGGGTALLGTTVFAADSKVAVFDLATPTLTGLGTAYTHISAQVGMVAAGTFVGNLSILSYNPVGAGTTPAAAGIDALGTSYA